MKLNEYTKLSTAMQPEQFSKFIIMIDNNEITGPQAKELFKIMFMTGVDPEILCKILNFSIFEESALEGLILYLLDDNPKIVEQYKAGNKKVLSRLMGLIMKHSKNQADPKMANIMLHKLASEEPIIFPL